MINWTEELREQGAIAVRMARNASAALQTPDLTSTQAKTIHKMVCHGASTFDGIVEVMIGDNVDNLNELAGQIREVWTLLVATSEEKLRTFQHTGSGASLQAKGQRNGR